MYHKVNWCSGSPRWGLYKKKEDGGIKREWEENLPAEYVDHVPFCPHITFGACQRRPRSGPPFSLKPKHSTAVLVHHQIPLSAGSNLLVWCVDEGWREASGCSIWLLSGHSFLWDVTESAGTGQQNTKSMWRVYLGNPKSMQDIWRLQREYTRASSVFHLVWLLNCKRLSYIRFWKWLSTVLK